MKKAVFSLVALLCALAVAIPAMADATPYASVRFGTFIVDTDDADTTDLNFGLVDNSRLGVNFKVSDAVSGQIELGVTGSDAGNQTYLRLAYGVYDFGAGTLTIGQDYAPFDWGTGAVAFSDNGLAGYGTLGIARAGQITARFDQGLYVSLIDNPNENADDDDVTLPLLAVGFDGKAGVVAYGVGAGYATYDNGAEDVDTYFVYAQGEVPAGPATVAAKIYYAQNIGEIGLTTTDAVMHGDDDADTIAGFVAVKGKINDKVGYEAGVGYVTTDTNVSGADDDTAINYYVDVPVQITKGFSVVPTVTVFDGLDDASGDGDRELWVGAKWQFDL